MKKPGLPLFCLLFALCALPLFTQEKGQDRLRWGLQSAYYFPHQEGLNARRGFDPVAYAIAGRPDSLILPSGDGGRDLGTGWGSVELQGWIDRTLTLPFLRGDGPLTRDNNVAVNGRWNLSPATTDLNLSLSLTPVAFLVFEQGNHLGTGWNAGIANGLGLNGNGSGTPETDSLPGIVYRGWLSGTFQFDMAAVLPEPDKWKHVVLQAEGKLLYQVFSGAREGEPWQYQADRGQNFNGWQFHSSTVLGYMIPDLPINFAGFMVETERRLGEISDSSPLASGGWGSDFTQVRLGPLFNWQIDDRNGLTVLIQCHNAVEYEGDSVYYNDFMNRRSTGRGYWYFERVALAYTMRL